MSASAEGIQLSKAGSLWGQRVWPWQQLFAALPVQSLCWLSATSDWGVLLYVCAVWATEGRVPLLVRDLVPLMVQVFYISLPLCVWEGGLGGGGGTGATVPAATLSPPEWYSLSSFKLKSQALSLPLSLSLSRCVCVCLFLWHADRVDLCHCIVKFCWPVKWWWPCIWYNNVYTLLEYCLHCGSDLIK